METFCQMLAKPPLVLVGIHRQISVNQRLVPAGLEKHSASIWQNLPPSPPLVLIRIRGSQCW